MLNAIQQADDAIAIPISQVRGVGMRRTVTMGQIFLMAFTCYLWPTQSQAQTKTKSDSYAAIAWHPDAADIWVEGNYVNINNLALQNALDACNTVMGSGCTLAIEWRNASVTVVRDNKGDFYRSEAGTSEAEPNNIIEECSAKQTLPCEVFANIPSTTVRRSPDASAHKYFAVAVWASEDAKVYDGKIYISSGHRSFDAANTEATKACSGAASRSCKIAAWSGNGFIQVFRHDGPKDNATSETSLERAQEAARAVCKAQNSASCDMQAHFDSRQSGLFVHEFAKAKAR
jgi:Domain of unknown function (DUF4189)